MAKDQLFMFLSRSQNKISNPKKVLVCEDDPSIVEIISYVLEEKGYFIVKGVNCGKLDQILESKPDLILLDLWMPIIDGPAVAKALKGNPQTAHIPIIIVSANNEIEKISQQIRADGFLKKPFDLVQLEEIAAKYLDG